MSGFPRDRYGQFSVRSPDVDVQVCACRHHLINWLEKHNGCFLLLYIGFLEICLQNFVSVRSLRDVKQWLEIIPDISGLINRIGKSSLCRPDASRCRPQCGCDRSWRGEFSCFHFICSLRVYNNIPIRIRMVRIVARNGRSFSKIRIMLSARLTKILMISKTNTKPW